MAIIAGREYCVSNFGILSVPKTKGEFFCFIEIVYALFSGFSQTKYKSTLIMLTFVTKFYKVSKIKYMAEELHIVSGEKELVYETLRPQIEALLKGETDLIANMANLVAALKEAFGFFWVGYYRVQNDVLVLGPFQGPIACTRIKYGKGVCGTAWKEAQTLVVANVEEFPGHIACNSRSKSEIVVPVFDAKQQVIAVLDIDSDTLDSFDAIDARYLTLFCSYLAD